MKILVFAHRLEVGGTQVNAIDLSAALRDIYAHEIVVFATPGPMVDVLRTKKLRYIPAPNRILERMWAFNKIVRQERPHVVHVWDWWQCMHALYVAHVPRKIPLVVTDMTSVGAIEKMLPKSPLTTFGTPERVELAKAHGYSKAKLLLPPVDLTLNYPGCVDADEFRKQHGIQRDEIVIVTVSRLDYILKLESLRRTIEAMGALANELPYRFVIVGDGYARQELQELVNLTNSSLNRRAILLTGEILDPRPAYAAADIVVGMGGSALRAMAFAKPVIIVGNKGFASTFSTDTYQFFLQHGIFGIGEGKTTNDNLINSLRQLAMNPGMRSELGNLGRNFVKTHFSVEAVSKQLNGYCEEASASGVKPLESIFDSFRTALYLAKRRQTWQRFVTRKR
ncbi:MAG: glycosyltransferase family 4 protein [Hyphomicrobiaceae bacterium]|nr:glycosyltransferase family 4 protein [Hyphomicrobiaceae bacterium]MCC0011212.1 glycosyltransferase family 4 protein [Hyphomicrobiaceae bacterium]